MLYMLLLYHDPSMPEPEDVMDRHFAVEKEARERDAYIVSEALQPVETATSVRHKDVKTTITDGPFVETKEVFGGFYVLDCKNLDEAIEYAKKLPETVNGGVEIRPVFNVPGWPYTIAADRRGA